MDQDGFEPLTKPPGGSDSDNKPANSEIGSITLILCRPKFRRHIYATIPFPSSYQEARMMAHTTFGTHTSYVKSDELSLRRVIRRKDGEYVWSIISEVDWNAVLERHGEEIGVFLPMAYPAEIAYQIEKETQPPNRLVCFQFYDRETKEHKIELEEVAAVRSLDESRNFVDEEDLYYDRRMVGTRAECEDYRNRVGTPKWSELYHSALFDILVELHPEPLVIRVDSSQL